MEELKLLLESCRSEETKKTYAFGLKKYFEFVGKELPKATKDIENKIIEYIIYLKKEGMSYQGISNYIVPVKSFYAINDVTLNVKKIAKFMPENRKVKTDRSYEHEEISKLLQIADERMRVVILVLASSGIRIGALPILRLRNIQDSKLIVYEKDVEEYFTFITPECKNAIDFYLDMRSRYGEKLNDNSYLIREQFDVRSQVPARPKSVDKSALQYKLYDLCNRSGIDKEKTAIAHSYRYFFTKQLVESKVNPEIREMLLGHKIGLTSAYYRPTQEEMYAEYEKAIDNLTIDSSQRLQRKVEMLEIEKSKVDRIELKLQLLEKQFNKKRKR
jgi:site-specific recombinase XerD